MWTHRLLRLAAKAVFPLAVSAVASCSSPSGLPAGEIAPGDVSARGAMIRAIGSLHEYQFYEEPTPSFQNRLEQGRFWEKDRRSYLLISGDGSFGKRLFMRDRGRGVTVVHFNRQEADAPECELYRCDADGGCLFLGEFDPALLNGKGS